MEIRSEKATVVKRRPVSFSVRLMYVLGMFLWLIGFNRLTKDDRLAAGICVNDIGRDE
jgi:hypothetical protein